MVGGRPISPAGTGSFEQARRSVATVQPGPRGRAITAAEHPVEMRHIIESAREDHPQQRVFPAPEQLGGVGHQG